MAACDGMNMNGPDQNYPKRNFVWMDEKKESEILFFYLD
jgi:hypothetical protein